MTPQSSSETTASAQSASQTEVFKPERTHLLAIALLTGTCIIGIGWAPQYLFWVLIFPALAIWWVLKSRTVVSEQGIAIAYAFKKNVTILWEEFAGVGFKRSNAYAQTTSGDTHSLPGVTFNSLPELAKASRGRIPDALTAGREAADDKVVIVHRNGQQVLMTKEEFSTYEAERQAREN